MNEIIIGIATWGIPVLLAITLHEVAHGWAALALGDRTAQMLGRLSLNPIKHIDPVGTIAIAGPASNFLQALAWALLFHFNFGSMTEAIQSIAIAGITINIVLIALNILPIPPLDGSRIVAALLPKSLAWQYDRLEPYGFVILIGLIVMNWLTPMIAPIFLMVKSWVLLIAGIAS